jgi:hypothetical protein
VATFGDMQTRIADELLRPDLISQVRLAILDAISTYEDNRFAFNQASTTFSTVIGQDEYTSADNAAIETAVKIDRLRLLVGTSRYPMQQIGANELDEMSISTTSQGQPSVWCYEHQALRMWQPPNQVYTVTMFYVARLATLSADSDSNAWTNDGERLIRTRAKINLIRDVTGIRTNDMANDIAALMAYEQELLTELSAAVTKRQFTGRIRPTTY